MAAPTTKLQHYLAYMPLLIQYVSGCEQNSDQSILKEYAHKLKCPICGLWRFPVKSVVHVCVFVCMCVQAHCLTMSSIVTDTKQVRERFGAQTHSSLRLTIVSFSILCISCLAVVGKLWCLLCYYFAFIILYCIGTNANMTQTHWPLIGQN